MEVTEATEEQRAPIEWAGEEPEQQQEPSALELERAKHKAR